MKTNTLFLSVVGAMVYAAGSAIAEPAIWESDYGSSLSIWDDDVAENVGLSFSFDYAGMAYTDIYVGSNGGVSLGGLGQADNYPSGNEFWITSSPMLAVFWSDMDMSDYGTAFFNDFGDRAVVTWDGIGTYQDSSSSNTFQLQMFADGKIIFGYNGIVDNNSSNFDTDIHVGLTEGNNPASFAAADYAAGTFSTAESTIIELFGYDDSDFDLDQKNIIFTPDGNGGYTVGLPTPGSMSVLAIGGLAATRRRRA